MRASQPPVRNAPAPSASHSSGSDPLAELARLIGQSDPFGEYGRTHASNAAVPQQATPAQLSQVPAYVDDRYPEPPPQYAPDPYPQQQQFGAVPGYTPDHYPDDADYSDQAGAPVQDHAYYDDVPPRRRIGIMAVAGVFALVVLGTAGAFGYRAIFGSSGSKGPPPVIKADTSPSKIVPAAEPKDPKTNKLIYDRVADRGQDEKLVSREEQPVDMNNRPQPQDQSAGQPGTGSGVVGTEPKKVHTIAIRPDGTEMASATPAVATPQQAPPFAAPASQRPQAAEQPPPPAPRQQAARPDPPRPPAPQPQRAAAPAPAASTGNAPLSLSPDSQPQASPAPHRPVRTAAVAQPAQIAPPPRATQASAPSSGGGYAVQVSSQRSEADAQAAFRGLQSKFPSQLGGKQAMIHRVDLGAKGIYFRAMVGPFANSAEAGELCSSLKSAGGQCIVQKN